MLSFVEEDVTNGRRSLTTDTSTETYNGPNICRRVRISHGYGLQIRGNGMPVLFLLQYITRIQTNVNRISNIRPLIAGKKTVNINAASAPLGKCQFQYQMIHIASNPNQLTTKTIYCLVCVMVVSQSHEGNLTM